MIEQVLLWGSVTGLIHFMVIGVLYGNPFIDRIYKQAQKNEVGVRKWSSQPQYLITQFLGTQIEVYILSLAFLWLRPMILDEGLMGLMKLGFLLSALRVYPRFWNMWIQSTYPNRLLLIELINGTLSTLTIIFSINSLVK